MSAAQSSSEPPGWAALPKIASAPRKRLRRDGGTQSLVTFLLVSDPQVILAVESLSPAMQSWYRREIVHLLRNNPYPSPPAELIVQRRSDDGHDYYLYYDGILPFVLRYFVDPTPIAQSDGMIYVARALSVDDV